MRKSKGRSSEQRAGDSQTSERRITQADYPPPPNVLNYLYGLIAKKSPRLALIIPLVLAIAVVIAWLITSADNLKRFWILIGFSDDPEKSARISLQRPLYPLEPLTASYQIEYSMDDPVFRTYAERLKKGIEKEGVNLEEVTAVVSRFEEDEASLKPNKELKNEQAAWFLLNYDRTVFRFGIVGKEHANINANSIGNTVDPDAVGFACMDPGLFRAIVKFPDAEPVEVHVQFTAQFSERVFTKYVWCKNLVRLQGDVAISSALDLLDRGLAWNLDTVSAVPPSGELTEQELLAGKDRAIGTLKRVSFVFPFQKNMGEDDPGFPPNLHYIEVPSQAAQVVLTADDLGLSSVLRK